MAELDADFFQVAVVEIRNNFEIYGVVGEGLGIFAKSQVFEPLLECCHG